MYNEVITLRTMVKVKNAYGDILEAPVDREVYARLQSIGQSEFYQAAASGFKPEVKFILADFLDYENEKYVLYQAYGTDEPETYSVIRTYRSGNQLELTCARGVDVDAST